MLLVSLSSLDVPRSKHTAQFTDNGRYEQIMWKFRMTCRNGMTQCRTIRLLASVASNLAALQPYAVTKTVFMGALRLV
jgi:hypothetical protein